MKPDKPNFIFFFPDEMRADALACAGNPTVMTPNMDSLAESGTHFQNCFVQHPVCTPSRVSLMTGWYPHVAGHRSLWNLLKRHEPSLFRYLHEKGYHIEWYGKNDLYTEDYFYEVVDNFGDWGNDHSGGNTFQKSDPLYYSFIEDPFPGSLWETGDAKRVSAGIDFLKSRAAFSSPFCLYLPLSMPHPVYAAPEPYHSMYGPEDVPEVKAMVEERSPVYKNKIREYRNMKNIGMQDQKLIRARYLGMVSYVDWLLGQLLDELHRTGLGDDTVIIVASDHGDWAGDYALVEKWPSALDDSLTKVPLIIKVPWLSQTPCVEGLVELFDIMPTVAELAGIEITHRHFAESLVSCINGNTDSHRNFVFSEGGYDPHEKHIFEGRWEEQGLTRTPDHIYYPKGSMQQQIPLSVTRAVSIRSQRYKFIYRNYDLCELYDLAEDPDELQNLYGILEYKEMEEKFMKKLIEWFLRTSDVSPSEEDNREIPGLFST